LGVSLRACGLIDGGGSGLKLFGEGANARTLTVAARVRPCAVGLQGGGAGRHARAELQAPNLDHHLGARRIANQARTELIAAGAKPRRDAITGREALTAGELRVARLAADGLTNREIAQALFITTKTAKAHLNRVYRKLRSPAASNSRARSAASATTAASSRMPA
jgi:DNA-binding CsgD family transcriptional regulator